MAGITISKASGFNDSLFGKSSAPISLMLEKSLEAFEQESAVEKIFSMRKSNHYAEKMTALSSADNFSPVGENGGYVDNDFQETFSKTLEHATWKSRFAITKEMIEDSNFDLMRIRASKFVQAYGRTREEFGTKLLAGATGNSITFMGRNFDTTCADGKPLFSTAHPSFFDAGSTQSNLYTNAFDVHVLSEMETIMQNFKGDKGEILGLAPDTIIIPNNATLKYNVFEAIGADKDPTTSNNGFNYQFGRWNVIVNPYWILPTGATNLPFILLDSAFNKLDGTAVWYDRVNLSVDAYEDKNTDSAMYRGRARWSAGFNNWRGMLMGGNATGTTL